MIEGAIAQRWARAVLQLAQEEGRLDEVREQLNALAGTLRLDDGRLIGVLESPSFSIKDKLAIVARVAEAQGLMPMVRNFLALAVEKGRGKYVLPVVDRFNRMADELTGVLKAELLVAFELAGEARDKVRGALEKATGKKIELEVKVDPALLGGAVVRLGSLIVDGSVRSQLDSLSRELSRVD